MTEVLNAVVSKVFPEKREASARYLARVLGMGSRDFDYGGGLNSRLVHRRSDGYCTAGAVRAPAPTSEVAEAARKAAIAFSFYSGPSLLIEAFIGWFTRGGYHRDEI